MVILPNWDFSELAQAVSAAAGRPLAFGCAVAVIVAWAVLGPVFHFSDTWQLVINTGTTIVTFLMVFLIQATQNRDALAIQTKLDALILASTAHDGYAGIDRLSEEELRELRDPT